MRQVQGVIDQIGLIQIDSVNVLARAHLLPLFSRLGPYDTSLLKRASEKPPRRLVEYWAHEASLVPPETHRLLRWRMERADREAWRNVRAASGNPELLGAVLAEIERSGPITAAELGEQVDPDHVPTKKNWGWNWPPVKSATEYLFWSGRITSAGRTSQFARRYDLTERVLPGGVHAAETPGEEEAMVELIEISARAHGVGTARCLRDYFRLGAKEAAAAIDTLVEAGKLLPVEVEGFAGVGYLHTEAKRPRKIATRALLAPFDPLVFERARLEELFGVHFRIEIYTPKAKRKFGYYVLPFLLNESIVGRVDLKADRDASALLVKGAFAEEGAPPESATELAAELELMAGWLELDRVVVEPNGDLADELSGAVG
ncbi:MAG: YcaQ family DNA glycosylase [Solirubrobacterales bacterium]|nr:YcaQ family DNA glycosylase [Solirubrobacterales bacterium]